MSNLNYNREHLHSEEMKVTDALSCAPLETHEFIDEEEKSDSKESTNIFVMRNLTEEVNDLDEIENMDLEALQEYIEKDIEYKALIKAIKEDVNVKKLHKDHPAQGWAGLWEKLSLLTPNRLIVMHSEKILMPEGQKIESVIALH